MTSFNSVNLRKSAEVKDKLSLVENTQVTANQRANYNSRAPM